MKSILNCQTNSDQINSYNKLFDTNFRSYRTLSRIYVKIFRSYDESISEMKNTEIILEDGVEVWRVYSL